MSETTATAPAPVATAHAANSLADHTPFLLSDVEVARFVVTGYHTMRPASLSPEVHQQVCADLDALKQNPGDGIYDAVPLLHDVWQAPEVRGFLVSILGPDYVLNNHRHWHCQRPGGGGMWHQDSVNQRHHQIRVLLALYYPHDVTHDMGPTVILPGSHQRNCPTDRMGYTMTYREQVPLAVPGGTIAFVHYDIWHTATRNSTEKARHMLKFLFHRTGEPTGPTWATTEDGMRQATALIGGLRPIACSQSDHYKDLQLRRITWKHLLGKGS